REGPEPPRLTDPWAGFYRRGRASCGAWLRPHASNSALLYLAGRFASCSKACAKAIEVRTAHSVQSRQAHRLGNRRGSFRNGLPLIFDFRTSDSPLCAFSSSSHSGLKCVKAFRRRTRISTSLKVGVPRILGL